MDTIKTLNALGIMSGISLDGAEFSLIKTDGIDVYKLIKSQKFLYSEDFRRQIRSLQGIDNYAQSEDFSQINEIFTNFIIDAFKEFVDDIDEKIDIIGFEGHTISFCPEERKIVQLGNVQKIADETNISTVSGFSQSDILLGGQGAPLGTTYYASLASQIEKPLAFINIGGTAMITYIGALGEMISFDCGIGNYVIDNFMRKHAGADMDYDGRCAAAGHIDEKIVQNMLRAKFLHKQPPKAFWTLSDNKSEHLEGLSIEDGAATATDFVAEAIKMQICEFLPEMPKKIIVCGGGTNNPTLLRFLRHKLPNVEITASTEKNFDFQTTEAQARGFIAVRRLYNMPATYPSSTGVCYPSISGTIYEPQKKSMK